MRTLIRIITVILMIGMFTGCRSMLSDTNNLSADQQAANDQAEASGEPRPRPKSEIAKINAQLGIAYLEQKNVQRAKMKLLLALKQSPESPEPWYSMAYFLEATGNKEEARKYYMKAVAIAPKRGDAQNNYGTFLCRSGQYQESIKHFMLAANAPDYLDPAAAYENAGLCSMKATRYQQAASYFHQALLKDPVRTLSLLKLADVEAKLGHYQKANDWLVQYEMVAKPSTETEQLHKNIAKHLHTA